jgi:hypothetical protein
MDFTSFRPIDHPLFNIAEQTSALKPVVNFS